jgi:integrase
MKSSLSFYERPPDSGRWYYHLAWYEDGERKQQKKGSFPSKREARRLGEAEEAKLRARLWRSETTDTLAAWTTPWLESLVVIGRKHSTTEGYRRLLDTYVLPRIGDHKLADIDAVTLDRLYAELLARGGRNGRALSARTVRLVHSILHKLLKDAVRKGLLGRNVAEHASPPSSKAARAPEAPVWSPDELAAFLEVSREDYYWPLWWTVAFTGLRRAEVCGLRWADVDLDAGTLDVVVTYNQVETETYEDTTKSERSARVVDLDSTTVAVLRSWRARQAELRLLVGASWHDSGRCFVAPDGQAIRPDTLTQAWTRAVKRSGLARITLHDLRHTHATHQLSVHANHREVADRLGHADPAFTLRTYVHTLPGAQRANAEAVAALVKKSATNAATKRADEDARDAS